MDRASPWITQERERKMTDRQYTRAELVRALEDAASMTVNDPDLSGEVMSHALNYPPQETYTLEQASQLVNNAANVVQEGSEDRHDYENSDSIRELDIINLMVNVTIGLLENPAARLEEIIEDKYSEDAAVVLGWVE